MDDDDQECVYMCVDDILSQNMWEDARTFKMSRHYDLFWSLDHSPVCMGSQRFYSQLDRILYL